MLMREALLNSDPNANVAVYDARLQQYADGTLDPEGTNGWKETFKSHGTETAHTVQINGGSANTTYMASLGYLYQGGILDQNDYNRYNARVNLNSQIRKWIAFGTQTSFYRGISRDGYNGWPVSSSTSTASTPPSRPTMRMANMWLLHRCRTLLPSVTSPPVSPAQRTISSSPTSTSTSPPIEGLSIKPLFSWRHDYRDYYRFRKVLLYGGSYNGGDNGTRRGDHNYYKLGLDDLSGAPSTTTRPLPRNTT